MSLQAVTEVRTADTSRLVGVYDEPDVCGALSGSFNGDGLGPAFHTRENRVVTAA